MKNISYPAVIFLLLVLTAGTWIYLAGLKTSAVPQGGSKDAFSEYLALPVVWGNLGVQMVEAGVIDKEKLEALYVNRAASSGASLDPLERGGISEDGRKLLEDSDNGNLKITSENSGFILNLLWALGIGNKSDVLENGPMSDLRYGGADRFASTGGWTLADGNPMNHYSRHSFLALTPEQRKLVEEVSKNIYRPCCNNSTHFPDCNHGMAMLGLLELMASQGVSEKEMYETALNVNSYWFPDNYLVISEYFKKRGIGLDRVGPKEILGANYSSGSGYQKILTAVEPIQQKSGSCGV